MWWALLAGALSVSVSVRSDPPAKGCAWSSLIPAAVQDLGTLQVVSTASVAVQVQVKADELQVRLTEAGAVLSHRTLPGDTACEARADGVALFVEQQLRQLGYVPPEPLLPSPVSTTTRAAAREPLGRAAPPAPASVSAPPPPPVSATPVDQPLPAPKTTKVGAASPGPRVQAARAWQLWASLGVAAQGPAALDYRAGAAAEVAFGPVPWSAFLSVAAWAPRQTELTRNAVRVGSLSTWAISSSLGGQWCPEVGPGRACARGRAGVEWVRGSAEGDLLFGEGSALKPAPIFGLGARYVLAVAEIWAVWLSAEALLRPRPATFVVEDARTAEDPLLGFAGGLGLSVRFF